LEHEGREGSLSLLVQKEKKKGPIIIISRSRGGGGVWRELGRKSVRGKKKTSPYFLFGRNGGGSHRNLQREYDLFGGEEN